MQNNHAAFIRPFCRGQGIEIGALHFPIRLPEGCTVRYLDRMPNEVLRLQYPELKDQSLVPLDIIEDGESLVNMLQVVRAGGFIILSAPDKRRTFAVDRPNTSNEHLLEECRAGPGANTLLHYREFAALVQKIEGGEQAIDAHARQLMDRKYSIHFHVWDSDAFLRFLLFTKDQFRLPMEIYSTLRNGNELLVALWKSEA